MNDQAGMVVIGGEEWLPLYGAETVVSEGKVITRFAQQRLWSYG